MTHIIFNDQHIELEEQQTVLSALLEQDHKIPNSCRAGICQTCMMQALDGNVPAKAQEGLKDTLKAQGYFLACSCMPQEPLHVRTVDVNMLRSPATVIEHELFAESVLHLRLKPSEAFDYRAGQYITLWKDSFLGRNYSLASVVELDDSIALHIRRIPDGVISNWLHDEIKVGDTVDIQAATGNCFYLPGSPEQNMLLAGTGTGMAPLIGIARDALRQGHEGDIHLLHGARQIDDLYLHDTLMKMAQQHHQFHYHANVLEAENITPPISKNPLMQQITEVAAEPADWRFYLCGDAPIVNTMKRNLFIAGASMTNIYSDPFISANDV